MPKERSKITSAYRVYTTKFDRVVSASDLQSVLGQMTTKDQRALDEAWNELQSGLLPWRTKLHIAGSELAEQMRSGMTQEQREDIVVSLLFDQSGSMRGQKMLFSAASADVAQEFLVSLRIGCEVLGFTTSHWRGGRSRRRWNWRFSPRNPGRLNDLLHVVYRDASDNRASTGGWSYRQMLRADLPKENIDGEAIEWAASRLRNIPRKRKILVVLSDGAPVDDSTLNENGPEYLRDHLRNVVEDLNCEGEIEIAALGIGFACHSFYATTRSIEDPSDLGIELLRFLASVLLKSDDARRTEATLA
jgi:cobaltochelatase CobT